MIIRKIIFEKNEFNIELYFLKNRYMSQYQNINKDNQKLFKFYDLNLLFYKENDNLFPGIEQNDLVILHKINNNLNESDITGIINSYINNFINDSIPIKLKNKINIWIKIKNALNDMLKSNYCNVNLYNYLLSYEIKQVKEKIENIEKNLLPVLFNDEDKDRYFMDFNNSINDSLPNKLKIKINLWL